MHRDAQVTIIMGRNGTGKSFLAQKIIKSLKRPTVVVTSNGAPKIWRPYPVIDPADPAAWDFKKGIKQIYFDQHGEDTFEHIYRNIHNKNLLLDDCKEYVKNNIDSQIFLKRLCSQFRHKMMDLFFVCHAPDDVPKKIWIYYSTAFIGATDVLFDKRRIYTDSAAKIIAAQRKVNAAFRTAKAKNNGSHYGIFQMVTP